jgi:N-acetylmuramoyl-L-alanine amidase
MLVVTRRTRCAAILVEGGFINNPGEAKQIARPEYRDSLARAIADGVTSYHATSAGTKLAGAR